MWITWTWTELTTLLPAFKKTVFIKKKNEKTKTKQKTKQTIDSVSQRIATATLAYRQHKLKLPDKRKDFTVLATKA